MAQIEVVNVTINETSILIEGIDIDKIILAEDLFQEIDTEEHVQYVFPRENAGAMKYLYKVVSGLKSIKATSYGARLEQLQGKFVIISDSFKAA